MHIFVIIACSEGLSMKKPDSQEYHVVFQNKTNNQIPSGYVKESLKGYNKKEEGSQPHYRSFYRSLRDCVSLNIVRSTASSTVFQPTESPQASFSIYTEREREVKDM